MTITVKKPFALYKEVANKELRTKFQRDRVPEKHAKKRRYKYLYLDKTTVKLANTPWQLISTIEVSVQHTKPRQTD
jgi:hypothetical protein